MPRRVDQEPKVAGENHLSLTETAKVVLDHLQNDEKKWQQVMTFVENNREFFLVENKLVNKHFALKILETIFGIEPYYPSFPENPPEFLDKFEAEFGIRIQDNVDAFLIALTTLIRRTAIESIIVDLKEKSAALPAIDPTIPLEDLEDENQDNWPAVVQQKAILQRIAEFTQILESPLLME